MGLRDAISWMKLGRRLAKVRSAAEKESKMGGFDPKVMLKKAGVQIVYGAGFAAAFAALGWLANTVAVTDALHKAGAGDALAGAVALIVVGAAKAGLNYLANRKVVLSPVDDQPINAPALKSPPVLSTEPQFAVFIDEYNKLIAAGVKFDDARRLALAAVTGVPATAAVK